MTSNFKFAGLLIGLAMLSGCGAGGGGSASNTGGGGGGGGGSTTQANARETLSFVIPIGPGHTTGTPNSRITAAVRKPDFVDANSDGAFTIIFDGTTIGPITFAPDGQGSGTITEGGTGPTGSGTLPNGGSYSFTSMYTYTNSQGSSSGNQAYADVSLTFTTIPGSHTIGVVQTNGACDTGLCISNTNGYVLAEGQTTVPLQPGTNAATTVVLKGVMQSMYFCDAACDGQAGTYSGSGYTISAFVADESGDAIPHQVDSTNTVVPFDNGSYAIVENDANGIVTITQPSATGIYTAPGTDDSSGIYGENITIACNKVGSTTVVAELLSTDPSSGSVTGYTYTANNYPAAGSILASVGADESFGNELSVSCSASGSITVQQKSRQS